MYIVEGNTGVGKSTFLRLLAKYLPEIHIGLEPIDSWQGTDFNQSLLAHFYQDQKRWAFTMETITMMRRVRDHLVDQAQDHFFHLVERSIYSGHYCFALNGYQQGSFTEAEWQVYLTLFNFLIPHHCQPPRGFIYLRAAPEITYQRIQKRNRLGEQDISLEYQRNIHERHETFLVKKDGVLPVLKDVPVLILDCSQEFETNPQLFKNHAEAVRQFLDKTSIQQGAKQPIIYFEGAV